MRGTVRWLAVGTVVVLGGAGYVSLWPGPGSGRPVWTVPGGDPEQGARAMLRHGCQACHVIDGLREATGRVGPKLEDIEHQIYLGGVLPNSPRNMSLWIQDPPEFSPATAMPDLGVSEADARHIAAYLLARE
ncbi:MAG: c-type cytochrome [Candidatus Krumholzibacteriia bacterium]